MRAWLVSYIAVCLAVLLSAWRAHATSRAQSPHWVRLFGWLVATAITAWSTWSLLGCTILPAFDPAYAIGSAKDIAACIWVAGFWASFPIAVALPLFGCLMLWHAVRSGEETRGWRDAWRFALGAALLPFAALLYGNAFVDGYNGRILEALSAAGIGFVTTAIAIQLPRYLFRPLRPRGLVRTRAV